MYSSRVTQLLVNQCFTGDRDLSLLLCVIGASREQRAMQIENFLPQPYSSCFFFRSFKSNLVDPFFSYTQTFPNEVKFFIFPGGFK